MNPLEQLKDLHLPPPPGIWPPAPGWWLAAAVMIAGLSAALWWWRRHWQHNRYRREALRLLATGDYNQLASLLQLVRRVAKTADPASPLAILPAAELLRQMDTFAGGTLLAAFGGGEDVYNQLASRLYHPAAEDLTPDQLHALKATVQKWLRKHKRSRPC